jgi:hypothetical protein
MKLMPYFAHRPGLTTEQALKYKTLAVKLFEDYYTVEYVLVLIYDVIKLPA